MPVAWESGRLQEWGFTEAPKDKQDQAGRIGWGWGLGLAFPTGAQHEQREARGIIRDDVGDTQMSRAGSHFPVGLKDLSFVLLGYLEGEEILE